MWEEIKRPATAIAIALTILSVVVGTLTSLYFYQKGEKHAEIAIKVDQVQVFDKAHVGIAPLTVQDATGNSIDNNIYAASIIIWNSGNAEIKKEDIREPYKFIVEGGTAKVLDISPILYSRDNMDDFAIDRKTGEISWRHFDEGEGFKLRMVYVDQTMRGIDLHGYSVNTKIKNGF
jgi:hypothetical protein